MKTSIFARGIRGALLNETILWIGIVSLPTLAMSLARIPLIGWRPIFLIHIMMVGMLWAVWILRYRIQYPWRAGTLLLGLGAAGIGGYMQLGPVATSGQLLILFLVAASIFLNGKAVFRLALAIAIGVTLIAWAAVTRQLSFQVDYSTYAHDPAAWGLLVVTTIGYGGAIAALAWRLYDKLTIHERLLIQANAELELRSQQLESADRLKSEILGSLQHELRTPLNGILGMSELLGMSKLTQEQRSWLTCQHDSAMHLRQLIERMLSFVALSKEGNGLRIAPINLQETVDAIVRLYQKRATAKGLSLTLHYDSDIPGILEADASRLEQLLFELLDNALSFTETGSIAVSVKPVRIDRETPVARVSFEIKDTGRGIPADQHEFILQPLSQVDSSKTRDIGGTGMGLAIVNRIVTLMDGSLQLDSESGKGSTFRIELPFSIPSLDAHPNPAGRKS